jgi:peptide/nickel transport system substrate-binding protein
MQAGRRARPARVVIALIAFALLAACAPAQPDSARPHPSSPPAVAEAPRRGGAITIAATTDAVSFHPYKTTDTASGSYQAYVYAGGLLTRDPHNPEQFIPDLAESWSLAEDRVTYTFRLRSDIRWSDGHPITAADFKWTFEQARNPDNGYPYAQNLETIVSYEAPDPRTLVIKLNAPLAIGLENADAIRPLPRHVWERLDWNDPNRNPEIMAPSVASGPFKLLEWQRDSHAIFVANDLYYKGRPHLDQIIVQIVPNRQMAFERLRAGEVDLAEIEPEHYEQVRRLEHLAIYEWWPAAASWSYLGFNLRRPHLQDVRVRRALAHAIDRQLIIDRIQYGLAQPIYSTFTPVCWCYNPDVPKYEYDPARARELLAQAGWRPGPDGVVARDGQRLRLRILYGPNTSKVRERIATLAHEEFRKVGVEVELQGLEWAAFLQAIKSPPFDWDLIVLGWSSSVDPHWMYQVWSEKAIPALNAVGYVNKRVEELFDQGAREFDLERRRAVYREIQQILSEDAPYIFLTMNKAFSPINKRVGGIEVTPLGLRHNIERWYIK